MSNPKNLQELADNLVASCRGAVERARTSCSAGDCAYHSGYATALQDTRATVLAMIAEQTKTRDMFRVSFVGRQVGAIGVTRQYHLTIRASGAEDALTNLYKRFEHISNFTAEVM